MRHFVILSSHFVFSVVFSGCPCQTTALLSGSVRALSRLLFEYHDSIPDDLVEKLLKTVSIKMNSKNQEVVRSIIDFIKICVVCLTPDALEQNLEHVVYCLFIKRDDPKDKFRNKVRTIVMKLVRKLGYDVSKNVSFLLLRNLSSPNC